MGQATLGGGWCVGWTIGGVGARRLPSNRKKGHPKTKAGERPKLMGELHRSQKSTVEKEESVGGRGNKSFLKAVDYR